MDIRGFIAAFVILWVSLAAATSDAASQGTCDERASHSYTSRYVGRPLIAIFDDGAQADFALLSYHWRLDHRTDEEDRISVAWNLTVPEIIDGLHGNLIYFGDEAAAAAEQGDFSFVKRFNLTPEQRATAHATRKSDDPRSVPLVFIQGPFLLEGSAHITVSRFENTITGPNYPDAMWALNVEPEGVPLTGSVNRTLIGSWPSGPLSGELQIARTSDVPVPAAIYDNLPGDRWIKWGTQWASFDYGAADAPRQVQQLLVYAYDARCGTFIGTASGYYTDDLLLKHLGLMSYHGSPDSIMVPMDTPRPKDEVPAPNVAFATVALALAALVWARRA